MTKPRKILIIDDDETSNYISIRTIQVADPEIIVNTVLNGMEAIDYFKNGTNDVPDFVLLDVHMPLMNGFEFLTWYNNSIHKGKTRIIIFSQQAIGKDEQKIIERYDDVVAYIEKPLASHHLSIITSKV